MDEYEIRTMEVKVLKCPSCGKEHQLPESIAAISNNNAQQFNRAVRLGTLVIRQRWTKHDDVLLKKLYSEGASITEISNKLNRNEGGVKTRIAKKHLFSLFDKKRRFLNNNRPYTEDEDNLILREIERGTSYLQLSKQLGRSKGAIQVRVSKLKSNSAKIKGIPAFGR